MSLDNVLCSAQQSAAVLDLILDNPNMPIEDDTLRNALYSIQDNVDRILKAVDECFDNDRGGMEVLIEMGVLNEFSQRVLKRKGL